MAHPPSPGKKYDLREIREILEALNLIGKTDGKAPLDKPAPISGFVGGFNPELVTSTPRPEAGRRPQPADTQWYDETCPDHSKRDSVSVSMPSPQIAHQSLMMQHAVDTPDSPPPPSPPPRRRADSVPSSPTAECVSISTPFPKLSLKVDSPPAAAPFPSPPAAAYQSISTFLPRPSLTVDFQHRRTVSNPTNPSVPPGGTTSQQCSGVTKAKTRCLLTVRVPSTYEHLDPIPDVYCHHHRQQVMTQSGIYAHLPGRPDKWIEFNDYIPKYLQPNTQLALRGEMDRTASPSDVPGYIYTFEIRDPDRPEVIRFKVGRTVNPVKRLDEWAKQCGSKEQVVRGVWPGTVEDDNDPANGSPLRRRLSGGKKGPLCHRVERLVHIELADLAVHAPYLDPKFPKVETKLSEWGSSSKKAAVALVPCLDCSKTHREIFAFPRPNKGRFKGREWDLIVKPVIEKWGKFVADHYPGEPSMDG